MGYVVFEVSRAGRKVAASRVLPTAEVAEMLAVLAARLKGRVAKQDQAENNFLGRSAVRHATKAKCG